MTGYTVHTGSTEKFSEGWDQIFGGSKQKKSVKKPASSSAAAKSSQQSKSAGSKTARKRSQGR